MAQLSNQSIKLPAQTGRTRFVSDTEPIRNLSLATSPHRMNPPDDMGRSKVPNNVAQPNVEGLCDFEQRVNRDRPFRPFHLTNINGMKVRFLGQFLLAESGPLTLQSNVLANQAAVFWRMNHSPLQKQQAARRSHKLPALDCACVANAESLETTKSQRKQVQRWRREESQWHGELFVTGN